MRELFLFSPEGEEQGEDGIRQLVFFTFCPMLAFGIVGSQDWRKISMSIKTRVAVIGSVAWRRPAYHRQLHKNQRSGISVGNPEIDKEFLLSHIRVWKMSPQ